MRDSRASVRPRPGLPRRAADSPMVGRDAELREVVRRLAAPPSVVLIAGEAGVGKTRLIYELFRRPELGAFRVLLGHCHPLRDPLPYGPIVEALRGARDLLPPAEAFTPLAGVLGSLLPELGDRLPPPPEPLGDPRGERHRMFRAIQELLTVLGETVLIVEDAHWIDHGSRELVRFLARQGGERLALIATYRREDLPVGAPGSPFMAHLPPAVNRTEVVLRPLDVTGVRAMTAGFFDLERLPPDFAEHLHSRTGGIPFAVEEVLRLLADPVRPPSSRALDELTMPPALRDSLLERLGRLPADARRVVEAAAVLGVPAPDALLIDIAGLGRERGESGLGHALARAMLRETGDEMYGFRHRLALQAVYDALSLAERRRLHRRAAVALWHHHDQPPLAQLAFHHREAGNAPAWVHYAEAAADQAIALGNDEGAARLLQDAMAIRLPAADRARLAVKLGKAALNGLATGEIVAILERILAEENLPATVRGELRLDLGLLLINQAAEATAGRAALIGAAEELTGRPALAARAMSALGVPRGGATTAREYRHWMDRAVRAAAAADDGVAELAVFANNATMLVQLGDEAAWSDPPYEDKGSRAARRQLVRWATNLADGALMLGHYDQVGRYLEFVRGTDGYADQQYTVTIAKSIELLWRWAVGRWHGLGTEASRLIATVGDETPPIAAEAELVLGRLALARGEPAKAERLLRGVARVAYDYSGPLLAAATGGLATIMLARDEPAAAWAEAEGVFEMMRTTGIWVWSGELAPAIEALIRSGDPEDARKLIDELADGLRGTAAPAAAAALTSCRAALAEREGMARAALRLYSEAERAFGALPRPYDAAAMMEAAARCQVSDEAAVDRLQGALRKYLTLGAVRDIARCRRALREYGVLPPSVGRRGYGERLSPREREVVRLVRQRHSNREIADALFLSPRTVEAHVAKALRKLGKRSRQELWQP